MVISLAEYHEILLRWRNQRTFENC